MNSKGKWLFAIVTILLLTLLRIDDPLHPELRKSMLINNKESRPEAYLYMMGFNALKDNSPLTKGQTILEWINDHEEFESLNLEELDLFLSNNTVILDKHELFCSLEEIGCMTKLMNSEVKADRLLEEYEWLATRFKRLITWEGSKTLSIPRYDDPYPDLGLISMAHRLVLLEVITLAESGSTQTAADLNNKVVKGIKLQLANSDRLINKMFYLKIFSEHLDIISSLSRLNKNLDLEKITGLNTKERDLTDSLQREALASHHTVRKLLHMEKDNSIGAPVIEWGIKFALKPNMTTNYYYPRFQWSSKLSLMKQDEVKENISPPPLETKHSPIRNSIGVHLNKGVTPDYSQYAIRIFDLNSKISIFNSTKSKDLEQINLSEIHNPYRENYTVFLEDNKQRLCAESPNKIRDSYRCLRLN